MVRSLKDLENEIFYKKHSSEAWKAIDKEVNSQWENSTFEEREEFVNSGAGDMIEQMLEFL